MPEVPKILPSAEISGLPVPDVLGTRHSELQSWILAVRSCLFLCTDYDPALRLHNKNVQAVLGATDNTQSSEAQMNHQGILNLGTGTHIISVDA